MAIKFHKKEASESTSFNKFTGLGVFEPVAFNPSAKTLEALGLNFKEQQYSKEQGKVDIVFRGLSEEVKGKLYLYSVFIKDVVLDDKGEAIWQFASSNGTISVSKCGSVKEAKENIIKRAKTSYSPDPDTMVALNSGEEYLYKLIFELFGIDPLDNNTFLNPINQYMKPKDLFVHDHKGLTNLFEECVKQNASQSGITATVTLPVGIVESTSKDGSTVYYNERIINLKLDYTNKKGKPVKDYVSIWKAVYSKATDTHSVSKKIIKMVEEATNANGIKTSPKGAYFDYKGKSMSNEEIAVAMNSSKADEHSLDPNVSDVSESDDDFGL